MQNSTPYPEYHERTVVLVKPDGVQRGLIGEVFKRCENKGLRLVAVKMIRATREQITEHYSDHRTEDWFDQFVDYVTLGPIVACVWEGYRAVDYVLQIKGCIRNPLPGTVRFDYCASERRSVMHCSASVGNAQKEIPVYFNESDLISWEWANAEYIHGGKFLAFKP